MQPIKNIQNGPNAVYILLRNNGDLISVHLWNRLYTFIPKHFLQNLNHPLVAKWTIYGRTLGRLVVSWVAFGDRATIFQQHCWILVSPSGGRQLQSDFNVQARNCSSRAFQVTQVPPSRKEGAFFKKWSHNNGSNTIMGLGSFKKTLMSS